MHTKHLLHKMIVASRRVLVVCQQREGMGTGMPCQGSPPPCRERVNQNSAAVAAAAAPVPAVNRSPVNFLPIIPVAVSAGPLLATAFKSTWRPELSRYGSLLCKLRPQRYHHADSHLFQRCTSLSVRLERSRGSSGGYSLRAVEDPKAQTYVEPPK